MTHPPAGPSTPPPPSGPRFLPGRLSEYLRQIAAARATKAIAAELAGDRGTSTRPLTDEQRADNYRQQNGTWSGGRLTPRQRRRREHKANLIEKRAKLAA